MRVWMASPPEVHSALLGTGAGLGPLLASAAAWSALGAQYAEAAEELMGLLGAAQAGAWQGSGADSYVLAHAPYLSWLRQAAADSAATAAHYETAAGAYLSALSAMPTLPELAANHLTHGVLVATNFFGLNTIPIALNEADYVRMWVQAATTMSVYQAVSGAAVASTPHTSPAPPILKAHAHADGDEEGTDPTVNDPLDQLIAQLLQTASNGQLNWDPAHAMVNGIPYDQYVDPNQPLFWLVRALELFEDFQQLGVNFQQNPALAFQYLVQLVEFDWPTHLAEIASWVGQSPQLFAAALAVVVAPVGAVGGFAGLAGLAGLPQSAAPIPALPAGPGSHALPAMGTGPPAPGVPGTVTASAPAPPAPAAGPAGPAPAVAGPPPAAGATLVPPYLIGGPGIGSGSGMATAARAARKAAEPDSAAAAAAAREADRRSAQARRRRRVAKRRHADQFMTMGVGVDPEWQLPDDDPAAADRGTGTLGVAGNAANGRSAAGMARLNDAFGGGPQQPMLPDSWGGADTDR
ncbi:putative PPE family protein PPE3 [Mycolicibacter senuensis]|uniref:Putative PPE family protein PPE3 n=1 Tax=Mycolicibacter senuensis TaxID=386913 RepID=A0A7I9XH62_9MYCO|nr:putative PPE family protein PPE3 [Mycolicibacter senuensis]